MLFSIGSRSRSDDVIDLLLACHRRVSEHLAIARRIATAGGRATPESIRDAAARVRTYFAIAFPNHRADEEVDIFPKLIGRSDVLDAALAELLHDHDTHEAFVEAVVEICALLEEDPSRLATHGPRLVEAVRQLSLELDAHMQLEERTVFPAIAMMSAEEKHQIFLAMRARRS